VTSVAADCSVVASSSLRAVVCTTSCNSSLPLPVKSLSAASSLCTNSAQAMMSTKRKRKFPGPAGVLPKLVRNDMINVSCSIKCMCPVRNSSYPTIQKSTFGKL